MRAAVGGGRHGENAEAGLQIRLHLRQLPPAEAHQARGDEEQRKVVGKSFAQEFFDAKEKNKFCT